MVSRMICIYLATSSNGFALPSAAARSSLPLATSSNFFSPRQIASRPVNTHVRQMSSTSTSNVDDASAGLADIGNNKGRDRPAPDDTVISWRERINGSIASSRKIRGGNYVQIATVDAETNEPRCRTVVFRGFLPPRPNEDGSTANQRAEESCVMKMITDLRSRKVGEASGHPDQAAELVWWFAKSSEQYRVRGRLQFVGGGSFANDDDEFLARMRKEQWENLSDMAREQFYWKDPGIEYSQQAEVPEGGRGEDGTILPIPDNFLLMLLHPTYVDYLRLTDNFRQVDKFDEDDWTEKRVNP